MLRSMFAAVSGLKTHQTMLDVTANDIANVNTIGYKSARTTFKDSLSQLQRAGAASGGGLGGANAAQVGLGVQLGSVDNVMSSGSIQTTGNPLDLAIAGEGWFRVGQAAAPAAPTTFEYSRAGNFTRNSEGYLVTQDGYYVVGRTASGGGTDTLLQIPAGATDVAIGQDGALSYVPAGGGARVTAGFVSLAKFANEAGLERASANRWRVSASSGGEQVSTPGGNYGLTQSGAVEMSNVDLAAQFTGMIAAQRGFQANSRVISTGDEMLQDLVNLKR
ncbi:MAG: flagellar hook-basal body complex protein [Actinomycetota bacterium]|nr:flagellar hook-basal body complex protein [Actinomycetota bacterium]